MEYNLVIKRNEVLTRITTGKNLETTVLSGGSQPEEHALYDAIYKKLLEQMSLYKRQKLA